MKPPRGNDYAARVSHGVIAGTKVAVISLASALPSSVAGALTAAECEVAAALRDGASYAEIARRRGVASRTIANQARSIFRKLGVGSRAGLTRKLTLDAG